MEEPKPYSNKEIKLTAAVYAKVTSILKHVKETGKLPQEINMPWLYIPMNLIIRERGTDITLDEDEKLIYDAIMRERRLPAGGVRLVEDEDLPESDAD